MLSAPLASSQTVQQQISELQEALAAQKAQLEAQQKLLEQQSAVIDELRRQTAAQAVAAESSATSLSQVQKSLLESKLQGQELAHVSMNEGRPRIESADDRSSIALRAIVQLDAAHHDQAPQGPLETDFRRGSVGGAGNRETIAASDLSNGIYFRRARFGVEGAFTPDFDYRFITEFGGAGAEGPTRINDAWISYNGFAPFRILFGATSPPRQHG